MKSPPVTVLCNLMVLLLLNCFIQMNAAYVIRISPINGIAYCDGFIAKPTEGNLLYSHTQIFGNAATHRDVEAFKYYCTNDLISSIINQEMVSIMLFTLQ